MPQLVLPIFPKRLKYITVQRSVKLLKDEGPEGFFKKKKGRTVHLLTPDKKKKAQLTEELEGVYQ